MAACRLDPPGRLILLAVWRVWFESRNRDRIKLKIYKLPKWLLDTGAAGPGIIISEVHYPIEARGVYNSSWLHILERSLYTGGGLRHYACPVTSTEIFERRFIAPEYPSTSCRSPTHQRMSRIRVG